SEAAKILYLAQPTITSQIKSLEEELNTTLFERNTKRIELTHTAKILYKYALQIIQLSESATKEIADMSDRVYGKLNIACSLTVGENVFPKIIAEFKKEFPLIEMSI